MKWKKPNGTRIETNDMKETLEYCRSLGWEEVDEETKKAMEFVDDLKEKAKEKTEPVTPSTKPGKLKKKGS